MTQDYSLQIAEPKSKFIKEHFCLVPVPNIIDSFQLTDIQYCEMFKNLQQFLLNNKDSSITGVNVFSQNNSKTNSCFFLNVCFRKDNDGYNELEWYNKLGKNLIY